MGRILADHILEDWLKLKRNEKFSTCSDAELSPEKKMSGADITQSTYKAWLAEQP